MTDTNPTTPKELTNTFLQAYATRITKELSEQLQVERGPDNGTPTFVLRFRYGKASEPFTIQGKNAREQFRDLSVHIERFLGART